MKSYGVTIQMNPLQRYFHMVLFIEYVVLTFKSVDEILRCYHSNETSLTDLLHTTFHCFKFYKKKFEFFLGSLLHVYRPTIYFVSEVTTIIF